MPALGTRSRTTRLSHLPAVLAATLVAGLLSATAPSPALADTSSLETLARERPTAGSPGSSGIGDPYWPQDGNGGIDVQHYDVHDRYNFSSSRLSGVTTLTVRATRSLSRFNLDLLLPVSTVLVDGKRAAYSRPNRHELRITPATPIRRGTTFRVRVSYAGTPTSLVYAGERSWLADGDEVVTMGQPHMAPWWFPANDHPRDKARFDITVTGPATHQVVSNGLLVDRTTDGDVATTHWRSRDRMAPYLAYFALGRFGVETSVRRGLPSYVAVSKALSPTQQRSAWRLMRRSGDVTAWLAQRIGPYPFESTGGLTTSLKPGFALENQTRPTYPDFGSGGFSTLVHELAHQWFGDSVAVRSWRDIWVNEGLATFMEVYYREQHGGPQATTWLERSYRDRRGSFSFWRLRIDNPGPDNIFASAVYVRGAMTAQALRVRLGDRVFWRLLRTWARVHRDGHGTSRGFEALAAEVSGRRLDGFFDAWLRAPRPPARTAANGLR